MNSIDVIMIAHGKVNCAWQKNILNLEVFGPFNLIGINDAFNTLKKYVHSEAPNKWFRMDVIDEQTLGSPEVMKIIGQTYVWSFENNCQMIAIVCANRVQLSLLNSFIETSGLNIKAFTHVDDAKTSIKAQADYASINTTNL